MQVIRTAGLAVALLGFLILEASAQPTAGASPLTAAPAPDCPAGVLPYCREVIKKIVRPTTQQVKHTRYCYDCKEVDFARTRCIPTPILSTECPRGCGTTQAVCPGCIHCGKPMTRKVLIKKFVTEEVTRPKCEVERVIELMPCSPRK